MVLLGNLEIIEIVKDDHQKVFELIPKIHKAGQKISDTVKKIQNVRYDVTIEHDTSTKMIQLDQEIKILSVEDTDSSFEVLKAQLRESTNFKLFRAKTIKDALFSLHQMDFDLILLDYDLPDGTGLELLGKLNLENIELPVIAITGLGNEQVASNFLKAGAFDYISKTDINKQTLIKVINSSIEKFRLKKEVDNTFKKIVDNSNKDQLTGLYNRRYMDGVLEKEVERARRYNTDLCCLMLDLDFFKDINDTYGHLCGDFVLQEFSKLLINSKRQSDYIFRYGGEEFVILTPQVDIQGAENYAEKLRNLCQTKDFIFNGHQLNVTLSIGVSSYNKKTIEKTITLIELADKALYDAKSNGRNCVRVYV